MYCFSCLTVRRYMKNSVAVIIIVRVALYMLYIASPFLYVMKDADNELVPVLIVCSCCFILFLELVFVEPYITSSPKKQAFKYFMHACSVIPVECLHYFADNDSMTLRYVELAYAVLFRVAYLLYRFIEISHVSLCSSLALFPL